MKLSIDTDRGLLHVEDLQGLREYVLYSEEAFEVLSKLWLKIGWNQKYEYTFSWLGRPIIQFPEDMLRLQEVIYRIKPDVIIETGVAHGGSLIFTASLCKAMDHGRVIGIDIAIRPHNRAAIESHELHSLITLVEGDSTDPAVVQQVTAMVKPGEIALILLDSNHTKAHVLAELQAYHPLVNPGSYIVATDGIMRDLHDTPRGQPGWADDNPAQAALEFSRNNPLFVIEEPAWTFNESKLNKNITYWPGAWLRRKESAQ